MLKISLACFILLSCALALSACVQPRQSPPPRTDLQIGIVGYSQPESTADMMAGYMAADAPRVDPKMFTQLDAAFEDVLRQETKRTYIFGDVAQACRKKTSRDGSNRVAALGYWVRVGRCMNVDLLLVPQILEATERDGGEMGVVTPASVITDIFLIDVKNETLVGRSRYDEVQGALTSNLLETGKFINRGGKWVKAVDLAREGMIKAVKDLSL